MQTLSFDFEIKRKICHLLGIIIPIFYLFTTKFITVLILLPLIICILYFDISRHYDDKIKNITDRIFAKLMRKGEESGSFKLSGASFMIGGFFLTALLFPKGLAICSWFILIISDCLAALVGTKIGTPLVNGKSPEGSVAFFISAIFISMLVYFFIGYNTSFSIIIISSLVTAISEFYSKQLNIDDNLLIPFSYCLATTFLVFIF